MKKVKLKNAVLTSLILTPFIATQARGTQTPDVGKGGCASQSAGHCEGVTPTQFGTCTGEPELSCVPEMSDYLAMSFVIMGAGMLYHFRRNVPVAQAVAIQGSYRKPSKKL